MDEPRKTNLPKKKRAIPVREPAPKGAPPEPEKVLRLGEEHQLEEVKAKKPAHTKQADSISKITAKESAPAYLSEEDQEALKEQIDIETEWLDEKKSPEAKKVPMGWFSLVAGVLALIIGLAVWQLSQSEKTAPETENTPIADETWTFRENTTLSEAAADHEKLVTLIKDYLAADSVEDYRGLIRHEERVYPLIEKHHLSKPFTPRKFIKLHNYTMVTLDKHAFIAVSAECEDEVTRNLLVEPLDGNFKVDWESDRSYQPIDPEKYLQERPLEATDFRVYLNRDNYYSYEYQDEKRYQSYRITFRDSETVLYGVVERHTPIAKELAEITSSRHTGSTAVSTAILKVRFEEGVRAPKTVLIEKLVSKNWPYSTSPE